MVKVKTPVILMQQGIGRAGDGLLDAQTCRQPLHQDCLAGPQITTEENDCRFPDRQPEELADLPGFSTG
jgi:hypothetical protein